MSRFLHLPRLVIACAQVALAVATASAVTIDTSKVDPTTGTYTYAIRHGEQAAVLDDPAVTTSPGIAASSNPANEADFIAIDGRGNNGAASLVFKFDFGKNGMAATRLRVVSGLGNVWDKYYPKGTSVTQSVSLDGIHYTHIPGAYKSFTGWVAFASAAGSIDLTALPGGSSADAAVVYYKVSFHHSAPGANIWNSVQWAKSRLTDRARPGFLAVFDVVKKALEAKN